MKRLALVLGRLAMPLIFVLGQATLLSLALTFVVGATVPSFWKLWLIALVTSTVFLSVLVMLIGLFGDVGKPRGGAQHVPKGQGLEVVRRGTKRGHTYHLLAADRGPRRVFEPFLVTLNDKSEVFPGFEHPGTEFIYLLEGSLTYRHGDETHLLKAGDALTFSGEVPHGPEKLLKTPIRMLSVIIYAEPPVS